jgi:YHS domain-containing protein
MLKKIMFGISLLMANLTAWAIDPVFTTWYNNLAIRGYDPVAYFTENKPIEGKESYEYNWHGATWRFASKSNLEMFKTEPEKYSPQYGGYCAYAVANNSTASIDPTQFSIVDGKLYLNYNKKIQQKWLEK